MITAIMTGYNRPQNLAPQLDAILAQTVPMEKSRIMLWYNLGDKPQIDLPGISTAKCNFNSKFLGRFAMAALAQTEYVAIFDDDTIPGSKWFENCLKTMETNPGIMGTAGIVLRSKNYQGCGKIGWNGQRLDVAHEVDLVGHAWFFKKEWLQYMWYETPISWINGEDIQFSYLCQKHGGIKTIVPRHPANDTSLWGSIQGENLGGDSEATYLKLNKTHYEERDRICNVAIERGWKPVFMRNETA